MQDGKLFTESIAAVRENEPDTGTEITAVKQVPPEEERKQAMKKVLLVLLALVFMTGTAMAEEGIPSVPFATVGEAMNADAYTGVRGSDEEHFVVVVETEGKYIRLVADMDEEALRLYDAIGKVPDVDSMEAAAGAYETYIETLPIAYAEEITAEPVSQEELDALAGKTLPELEEAGYEFGNAEGGRNDEAFFTCTCGLYNYVMILNETYTAYLEHSGNGYIGDLTIKSAEFAGVSRNAADLNWHADGTVDTENDPWARFSALMDRIQAALESGEDLQTIAEELIGEMPEREEEIRMLLDLLPSLLEQAGNAGTDTDP